MSTINAAQQALELGWSPIPIPRGQKAPTIKGWQGYRAVSDRTETEFDRNGNIGLLLGEPSNGLVDVDLDCEEAMQLAEALLPRTDMKSGRGGLVRHYWYEVDHPPRVEKWKNDSKQTIVELRGTGGQTVIPPSIHPTGQPYEWVGRALVPARGSIDGLRLAVARLAHACRLVQGGVPYADAADAALDWHPKASPDPDGHSRYSGTAGQFTQRVVEGVTVVDTLAALGVESIAPGARGRCPAKEHRTEEKGAKPFSVADNGETWYCHACDVGGGVIELAAAVRGVRWAAARKWLADACRVADPFEDEQRARQEVSKPSKSVKQPLEDRSGVFRPIERSPEPKEPEGRKLRLTKVSSLVPEDTEWLWFPYFARGELTVIAGMPGTGKSNFTRYLATLVSLGLDLEGKTDTSQAWLEAHQPGRVDMIVAEDHPGKVVTPRLILQGADLERVQIIDFSDGSPFTADSLATLRGLYELQGPPALLVVDPASSLIPVGVDANAQSDVKQSVTGPLAKLAADFNICTVLVTHVAKKAPSSGSHVLTWIHGSIEWSAGARAAMVFLRHQHDPLDKVVRCYVAKQNLGPEGLPFSYEIVGTAKGQCLVEWRGMTTDTPHDLTARPTREEDSGSAKDRAAEWLQNRLQRDPLVEWVCSGAVKREAHAVGISEGKLKSAREILGVKTRAPEAGTGKWEWSLP